MSTEGPDADDRLLGRLKESASSDAAVRQLRRRYDLLRNDYERLIDRLGELEDRLAAQPQPPESPAPLHLPASAPHPEPRLAPASPALGESLATPLLRLRDEYLSAIASIKDIVSGLDGLAAAAFKGQHSSSAPEKGDEGPRDERPRLRPSRIQVAVRGSGFGQLLDFQERVSSIPGVARVSINAIDNERANLVVELDTGPTAD